MKIFYIKYQAYDKAILHAKKSLAISLNIHGEHSMQSGFGYR